jgi:hypothetical protein
MADTSIFNVPMEQSLELMPPICTDGMYAKRKSLDHVIYEINGISLSMKLIDRQGSNPGGIVYCGILEPTDLLAFGVPES